MLRTCLVAFLLCALLPFQARAQASSPPPLVPAQPEADPYDPKGPSSETDPYGGYEGEEEEKPRGELIPHRWKPSGASGSQAPRLLLESVAGMVLGTAGVIPGALLFWNEFCLDCSDGAETLFASLGLMFVGMSAGSAIGVQSIGALMGGQGQPLPTFVGATLGTLGGTVTAALFAAVSGDAFWIIPLITFPTLGAMLGYELSQASERARLAPTGSGVTVVPVVSASPSGGLVAGLVGRF